MLREREEEEGEGWVGMVGKRDGQYVTEKELQQ
jgi:hypothetical protein